VAQIIELDEFAVVGKFYGRRVSIVVMGTWLEETWKPVIGYTPTYHLLSMGWIN
jgi:hypothetical protein